MKRVRIAFFIAPLAPFFLYLLINPAAFIAAIIFGLPIAYLIAFGWGVPLYFVVKKRPKLQRFYTKKKVYI